MIYDPKEVFILKHDDLVAEYLEAHPEASEAEAYDLTADAAMNAMQEHFADMVDYARMKAKEI